MHAIKTKRKNKQKKRIFWFCKKNPEIRLKMEKWHLWLLCHNLPLPHLPDHA